VTFSVRDVRDIEVKLHNLYTDAAGDIRISNQFLITRALHFAQLRQAYYQASVTGLQSII